jgi:chromate transporter
VNPELRELARLFLKLGTVSFGGPAVHIAMMEDEVVRRRQWLTHEQFLDYVGATNLIPGPNSTELAIHIGHARAGWPGLIVAGAAFILPAMLIVGALAWVYVRFNTLPAVEALLYGVKPVVIAVVVQAVARLGRSALKSRTLVALGVASVLAAMAGVNELLILLVAGAFMAAAHAAKPSSRNTPPDPRSSTSRLTGFMWPFLTQPALPAAVAVAPLAASFSMWSLFGTFVKIGSVLFGSGYVLVAFLRADLVQRLGWLTEQQLLDAVAIGQVTPGPVFTTATFVGYLLGGSVGAVVATVGIFLPAFVFVALSASLIPRLRRSRVAGGALDGVNVASLALMAVVTGQLGRAALVDPITLAVAVVSAILLMRFRVSSAVLVLGGAGIGLATLLLQG